MVKIILEKIMQYLPYPTTWKALTIILGYLGYQIAPEYQTQIIEGVGAIITFILLFFSDADVIKKKK